MRRAPLKQLAHLNQQVLPEETPNDFEFDYIDIASVSREGGIGDTTRLRFASAPSRARRVVRSGDVIVSTVRTYLGAVAPITDAHDGQICSTGFAVLTARRGVDPRFLCYATSERGFVEEVVARSTGVSYPAINPAELARISIPHPDLEDQRVIAAFLDRECQRIEDLLQASKAPPELVNELFRSRLAESGSGYLKRRLKSISSRITSGPRGWGEFTSPDGRVLFIGIGALQRRSLSLRQSGLRYVNPPPGRDEARASTEEGDVLLSITADLGTVGLVPSTFSGAVVSQHVALVRPDPALVDCRWLALMLKSPEVQTEIRALGYGGTKQGLGLTEVGRLEIPLPQLTDQRAMLDALIPTERAASSVLPAAAGLRASLAEYRDALITEAVTGQLDVTRPTDRRLDESAHAAMEGEEAEVLSS